MKSVSQTFAACGEKGQISFFYRHVREKKHFSGRKCASAASAQQRPAKLPKVLCTFGRKAKNALCYGG